MKFHIRDLFSNYLAYLNHDDRNDDLSVSLLTGALSACRGHKPTGLGQFSYPVIISSFGRDLTFHLPLLHLDRNA